MEFDIGTWWHWLFIAAATLGSAFNACRVFFTEYDARTNPFFIPFFHFFYELAGSFAGWMSLWYLLPLALKCSGGDCISSFAWHSVPLLAVAVIGICGWIPSTVSFLVDGIGRFTNPSA